jgi:hypothetical protein
MVFSQVNKSNQMIHTQPKQSVLSRKDTNVFAQFQYKNEELFNSFGYVDAGEGAEGR